MLIFNWLL